MKKLCVIVCSLSFSLSLYGTYLNDHLLNAVQENNLKQVKDILENAPQDTLDINATTDSFKFTPLHWAVQKNNKRIIKLLIKHGAQVNCRDIAQMTPLHYAPNQKIATLLIGKGADVNAQSNFGASPLHCAESQTLALSLIRYGAHVNSINNGGKTPLHYAIDRGSIAIVRLLLSRGADIYKQDHNQESAFELAKIGWHKDIAILLNNYDMLLQTPPHNSMLPQAIKYGLSILVQRALQAGIEPYTTNLKSAKKRYRQTREEVYKEIGRILIQNIGFTTDQSRVSKAGVHPGLALLPAEILKYIRIFLQ